jgi:hypothetical protein
LFAADYGTKWPKAAAKITDDLDVLLAFYDYPVGRNSAFDMVGGNAPSPIRELADKG